jgi:hypothetical protein
MITATLFTGNHERECSCDGEDMDALRIEIEKYILPLAKPGDCIEIGEPQ